MTYTISNICIYFLFVYFISLNRGELNKVKGEADAKTKDSEEKAKTIAQVIILTLMLLVPNLANTNDAKS